MFIVVLLIGYKPIREFHRKPNLDLVNALYFSFRFKNRYLKIFNAYASGISMLSQFLIFHARKYILITKFIEI